MSSPQPINTLEDVRGLLAEHPDFPCPGVLFQDIFPIFHHPAAVRIVVNELVRQISEHFGQVDAVIALDARGFLFGPLVCQQLDIPFIPVRKAGKLPGTVIERSSTKEYGADVLAIPAGAAAACTGAIATGRQPRAVVLDDLLATGGTAAAAVALTREAGFEVAGFAVMVLLTELWAPLAAGKITAAGLTEDQVLALFRI
ncbi:hypothetical protein H696_02458 [Fonticula alba]|uniref:adenine phosphoribosyltransferase n=1 Tax=Fonticula alba TaxID=691883 RepID=A0A058ZAU2_FONAL|nr:hypothetical protein H696_02458 [Fonticula alba]KCV71514.1 hypothetical protein H696_02458 [Fonticula alba]|eukprot:XP_009494637.1 hypothetical protein H696_02458 [Fonticula alba]